MKYLFVCKYNLGRSQMAEGFFNEFNKFYKQKHHASSAGTKTKEYGCEGSSVPSNILQYMWEVDINIESQVSKQLTPQMVNSVDRVVVMCEREICPDYLLQSDKTEFWPIPDPKETGSAGARNIRDDIGQRVNKIFNGKK